MKGAPPRRTATGEAVVIIMIKAVIIGFAHMHVNEVAEYILGQPETLLRGIADVAPTHPELCEKRYTREWNRRNVEAISGIHCHESYTELLDRVKPDCAYILCENVQKPRVALECARRGVNIIIEKPLAADLAGAEEIAGAAEKYGVEVIVNWPVAWRGYLHRQKRAADDLLLGRSLRLNYQNGHTGPLGQGARHRGVAETADEMTDEERGSCWWYHSDCGGGALLDILCYGCYFSRWYFGLPLGVSASEQRLSLSYADCGDNAAAIFRYADRLTVAEGSWTIPRRLVPAGPQLLCEDGALWCSGGADSNQSVEACTLAGEDVVVPEFELSDDMRNLPWHYAAHRLRGKKLFETLELGFNLDVMRMLDAATRSSREGREVEL